jgi:hypothetical protein
MEGVAKFILGLGLEVLKESGQIICGGPFKSGQPARVLWKINLPQWGHGFFQEYTSFQKTEAANPHEQCDFVNMQVHFGR